MFWNNSTRKKLQEIEISLEYLRDNIDRLLSGEAPTGMMIKLLKEKIYRLQERIETLERKELNQVKRGKRK